MSRHLRVAVFAIGMGLVVSVLSCASTESQQRKARAADFNQWLGQAKEGRVKQVGPPDSCTGAQTQGGEICEWRTNGNSLRYRYDSNGIARHWMYTNRQLGVMETAQDHESQEGVWQSIKDSYDKMNFGFAGTGR